MFRICDRYLAVHQKDKIDGYVLENCEKNYYKTFHRKTNLTYILSNIV